MITKNILNKCPSSPGIYFFKQGKTVLYIGKSVNIKARIKSHIENAKTDRKELLIINQSDSIDNIVTDSNFYAILLESEMIQKYKPKYNVILKDDKSELYIEITTKDEYPKVLLTRKKDLAANNTYFGPFSSVRTAAQLISEIRKIIPFCTQRKVSQKPCFYSKIGLCSPCPNLIYKEINVAVKNNLKKKYYFNIKMAKSILKRKADMVLKKQYILLKSLIKSQKYEEAIPIRNKISRLENLMYNQSFHEGNIEIQYNNSGEALLNLINLLRRYYPYINNLSRVECFDVSNINQKQATASMVVFVNGIMNKNEYRRFKVKNIRLKSDIDMLREVITRRFNNKWRRPNLLVVDGGKPQVSTVLKLIKQLNLFIPVIGIAKRPDRLIIGVSKTPTVYLENNDSGLNLIRHIRDESHRFAKKYHVLLREMNFLI